MLIRHTLLYLPAQLLAPIAQLASMVLWTHWLLPAEMGVFTLVTVAQEVAYLVCLGWFSIYALRYLPPPEQADAHRNYLGTENATVLASLFGSVVSAALVVTTLPEAHVHWTDVGVVSAFFATKALNAHYAERARAQSAFLAFTALQTAGPVGGLALGWLAMQQVEPSATVLLGAYALAQGLGCLLALPGLGMSWRLPRPDLGLLKAAMAFGGPMLGLSALGWVGENYIRYLVQWVSGAETLGLMVVGWALGRRAASVASMLVTTAAFPIASRLLNEGKREEALAQLRTNAILLIGVLLPVTVGVELLGGLLVSMVVAADYRQITTELLGLSMAAGAVRNLHMHVTDQLMVLERRVGMLARLDTFEILACTAASLAGLLLWDVRGAVIGQGVGSLLALALSIHWARRHMGFEWPWAATAKIIAACGVMVLALALLPEQADLGGLVLASGLGALAYGLTTLALFRPDWRRLNRVA